MHSSGYYARFTSLSVSSFRRKQPLISGKASSSGIDRTEAVPSVGNCTFRATREFIKEKLYRFSALPQASKSRAYSFSAFPPSSAKHVAFQH
jgi:hypothetical protein